MNYHLDSRLLKSVHKIFFQGNSRISPVHAFGVTVSDRQIRSEEIIPGVDKRRVNFCVHQLVANTAIISRRQRNRLSRALALAREREKEVCSLLSAVTNSDALPAWLGSARRVLKPRSTCNGGDLARYVNTDRNYQPGGRGRRRILMRR